MFGLEAYGKLAREALDDAGMALGEIDGILCTRLGDAPMFAPAAVTEYLGIEANFGEVVDLGGANATGMVWRAAAAIEAGVCDACLCLLPSVPAPPEPGAKPRAQSWMLGADAWGAPHGQFDAPYGLINPNSHFAMVAQRYMHEYDLEPRTLAKVAVQGRENALQNPKAIFRDQPITIEDVLNSPMVVDPLHLLEIVMPCAGGAGVVVTTLERAQRTGLRPVVVSGFGEHITHKSITYAPSLTQIPIVAAADRAFAMAGVGREAIDVASMYDCYTITVLVTIEDSGFCAKGVGPVRGGARLGSAATGVNTHGGQWGMGQGRGGGACRTCRRGHAVAGRRGGRGGRRSGDTYGTGGCMWAGGAGLREPDGGVAAAHPRCRPAATAPSGGPRGSTGCCCRSRPRRAVLLPARVQPG